MIRMTLKQRSQAEARRWQIWARQAFCLNRDEQAAILLLLALLLLGLWARAFFGTV